MTIVKARKEQLKRDIRTEAVNRLRAGLEHGGADVFSKCVTPEEQTFVHDEVKFICKVIGNL